MGPGRAKPTSENRYELTEKIGEGGMGAVWKAQDRRLGTFVALKTLLDIFDEEDFRRFKEECQKLIDLPHHPNIIQITDIGEFEQAGQWKPFFTMPMLSGATLAERLEKARDQLTIPRVVDIASQVCRGLQLAHEHSVIHRDIKPSNIFVLNDFSVQIIDFGVAHRTNVSTRTVGRKGTLYYMSPEQVESKPLSAASDIFSLGVVCYEVLSGRRPFDGTEEAEVVESIRFHQPPALHEFPRGISLPVSQAIHKAMAKKPSDRYISAAEFAEVLLRAFHMTQGELFPLPRPRLQLATSAFQKGDFQFARDLLDTLQAEGISHPEITQLDKQVDAAIKQQRTAQGIDASRSLTEAGEFLQALKKIRQVLAEDPDNTDARALEKLIESKRTDADVEEWLKLARQHMDNFVFDQARQALDRVKKRRPKEPRAALLLIDVERLEQEFLNLQKEKQRHFEAVQTALQRKDISSASSHAERLWDLEQKRPDISDASRMAYHNICQQVRTQRESIDAALQEAGRHVEAGKLGAALAICLEQLEIYPTHEHLLSMRFKIEELQQQALSARMAEVDRYSQSEPDLNKRVKCLEEALADYPGESHFERALQQAQNLRKIVENIVSKAKAHEDRKEFGEAQQEWLKLKTVYPRYPNLGVELERITRFKSEYDKRQARTALVREIDRNIERGNFNAALDLIRGQGSEYKDDVEIQALERIATQGTRSQEEALQIAAEGRRLYNDGFLDESVSRLRKAYDLHSNNAEIVASFLEILTEHARRDLNQNQIELAEDCVHEAMEIDPDCGPVQELLQAIRDRREERFADNCIAAALDLKARGDLKGAMAQLEEGLRECPGNQRILQRKAGISREMEDERARARESARRLMREAESINDPKTLRQFSGRLQRISQRYAEDAEMQKDVEPFIRRLQTIVDSAPAETSGKTVLFDPAQNRPDSSATAGPAIGSQSKPQASHPAHSALQSPDVEPSAPPNTFWAAFKAKAGSIRSSIKTLAGSVSGHAGAFFAAVRDSARWAEAVHSFGAWSRAPIGGTPIRKGYLVAAGAFILVAIPLAASWSRKPIPPVIHKKTPVSFRIAVEPSDAEILIDSRHAGKTAAALTLMPGPHILTARLPGYQTLEQTILVNPGLHLKPFSLEPIPLRLRVFASAANSSASIDEKPPEGALNGEIFFGGIAPGPHTLKTNVFGVSASANFDFHPGQQASIISTSAPWGALLVLTSFGGHQSLVCNCANTKVSIDRAPAEDMLPEGLPLTLPAGKHQFAVTGAFTGGMELDLDDSPSLFATFISQKVERLSEPEYSKKVDDLWRQYKYAEGLQLAKRWLGQYPDSQQAKDALQKMQKAADGSL